MDWFKKHSDAVAIVVVIFLSMIWVNGKFSALKKDIAVVKTVMIMKGIMPEILSTKNE